MVEAWGKVRDRGIIKGRDSIFPHFLLLKIFFEAISKHRNVIQYKFFSLEPFENK